VGHAALAIPFVAVLVAAAAIDLRLRIVPNRLLVPAAAWAVAATAALAPAELPGRALAASLAFAALLAPALIRPRALGMGDVKLAGMMGLYLGTAVVPALTAAFVTGAGAGAVVLIMHGRAVSGRAIPFAPFLAAGGLVGLVWGPELVAFYLNPA
jgi:leader peptidase (prepilin peptidase)/N-methyltransferase